MEENFMEFLKKIISGVMFLFVCFASVFSVSLVMPKNTVLANRTESSFETASENSENKNKTKSADGLKENSSTKQKKNSSQKNEVETAAKATVKGKISEEVLSPYSANLSYNKIYIKNSTGLKVDLKKELETPIKFKIAKSKEPQVLIVSTHTTESYMLEDRNYYTSKDATGSTDKTKNVVFIGSVIKKQLEENGIVCVQSDTIHDHPQFSGSYNRSAQTIKSYLKKYPSVKVVLDIHRDSVNNNDGTKIKPTVTLNGKKAAQVMLVSGCMAGEVENFPNWRENFRLAIRLQQNMEVNYPSLARAVTFTPRRYNQNLTTGSLLLEIGTEANTLSEAAYSASLVGKCLSNVLNNLH